MRVIKKLLWWTALLFIFIIGYQFGSQAVAAQVDHQPTVQNTKPLYIWAGCLDTGSTDLLIEFITNPLNKEATLIYMPGTCKVINAGASDDRANFKQYVDPLVDFKGFTFQVFIIPPYGAAPKGYLFVYEVADLLGEGS